MGEIAVITLLGFAAAIFTLVRYCLQYMTLQYDQFAEDERVQRIYAKRRASRNQTKESSAAPKTSREEMAESMLIAAKQQREAQNPQG